MSLNETTRRELLELVAAQRDGLLDADGLARLEALVVGDDDARQLYLGYVDLCANLYWARAEAGELVARVGSGQESGVRTQESEEPSAKGSQPVGHAPRDDSSRIDLARGACPTRSKSWLDRASRRPVRPALAVAALVMISVVAWMGVTMVKTQIAGGGKSTDEQQKPTKPEFVAWLMAVHETQWLHGTEPQKTRLMPGQRLAIAKGLIEIQYRTRAVVVIEGPAEFWVGARDSGLGAKENITQSSAPSPQPPDPKSAANRGFLALGKLVARVDGEKAKGFTIDTPSARVKDFGTEFGVEVLGSGAAEFVVLTGEVDVIREASGGQPAQRIRLTRDQGAFVAAKGAKIKRRANVDEELVTAMRARLDTVLPQAVLASGSNLVLNPNFLFTATGHSDGDNGGHNVQNDGGAGVSNWTPTTTYAASDPVGFFAFDHEYFLINVTDSAQATEDLYQVVTVTESADYKLSMVATLRADDRFDDGFVFLELYAGNTTTFGSPITPTTVVAPTLDGTLQTYSNTYSLTAGDYTVRVGGTVNSLLDDVLTAGISEVRLVVVSDDDQDDVDSQHNNKIKNEQLAAPPDDTKRGTEQ